MKNKIKVRWWIHLFSIFAFAIVGCYFYYLVFEAHKNLDEVWVLIFRGGILIMLLILCHLVWLLVLLIKLLLRKQFISSFFILLLGLADFGIFKVVGFVWAVITGGVMGDN